MAIGLLPKNSKHTRQKNGEGKVSVMLFLLTFISGYMIGTLSPSPSCTPRGLSLEKQYAANGSSVEATSSPPSSPSSCVPQVYNFMKEFECRPNHLAVPAVLNEKGHGKVVVDIGLDDAKEFFAALEAGYSVYGFEANPITAANLRKRCEDNTNTSYKCVYVNANNIIHPLPPIHNGGYLIEGGAGSTRSVMSMSLAGAGSSFVEVAPDVNTPMYKNVTILPLSDVVQTDVFFLKMDVQGFELEVLKGAKKLFDDYVVKTVQMEVYPRGLGNAGVNFDEYLSFIWSDLGMFCSSANVNGNTFKKDHATSFPGFAKYLESLSDAVWWGTFDDFYCFNYKKRWIVDENL